MIRPAAVASSVHMAMNFKAKIMPHRRVQYDAPASPPAEPEVQARRRERFS